MTRPETDANDAPVAVAAGANPFLRMTPANRGIVLAGFAAYLGAVALCAILGGGGSAWVLLSLTVFMVLRLAPMVLWRREYGWFHPMVFGVLFTGLELLRNFPMYAWGIQWHRALPEYDHDRLSVLVAVELALTSLSLLAYYAGYFLFPIPNVPRMTTGRPRLLKQKVMATVVVATLAMVVFLQSRGGLLAHMISWGTGRHQALSGTGFLAPIFNLAGAACLLWIAVRPQVIRSPVFWGCVVVSLAMQYLYSGSRSAVVYLIVVGLLVWMMSARRLVYGRALVASAAALLLIGVLGDLRRSTFNGKVDWTVLTQVEVGQTVSDAATGELVDRATTMRASLAVLARVPREVGLLHGSSYLAMLGFPVPRAFWPGKPALIDGQVGATFFGVPYGIPVNAVGEAYWNFDVVGVFLVFLLFGIWHRWLARFMERNQGNPGAVALYGTALWMLSSPGSMTAVNALLMLVPVAALAVVLGLAPLRVARGRPVLPPLPLPRGGQP